MKEQKDLKKSFWEYARKYGYEKAVAKYCLIYMNDAEVPKGFTEYLSEQRNMLIAENS